MNAIARIVLVVALVLGCALFAAGVVVHVLMPGIVKDKLKDDLVITTPRSDLYSAFVRSTDKVDVYMTYHMFNLTNADEVMMGKPPKLVQVGPYVYKERKWKPEANVSWHPNATVTFIYKTEYDFQPDMSAGTEEDPITTADVGVLGVLKATDGTALSNVLKNLLADASKNSGVSSIFVTRRVRDLLWGYTDTLLATLIADNPFFATKISSSVALQSNASLHTGGALSACYSGGEASKTQPEPPSDSPGLLTMWEGMTNLSHYWTTNSSQMINGTDGSMFHSGIEEGDSVYAFVDTMYRSVLLTNVGGQREDYEGVSLLRLVIDPSALEAASVNPDNLGFGIEYAGIQPAPDSEDAPIYFSKPYFLDANLTNVRLNWTSLGYAATGPSNDELRPLYETFLDVEPHTGQVFHVHKRLQVSADVGEIPYVSFASGHPEETVLNISRGIHRTFLPIMWVDEHTKLPSNLVEDFKKDVLTPIYLGKYGGIVAAVVGALLFLVSVVCLVRSARRRSDDIEREPLHGDYTHSMNKV